MPDRVVHTSPSPARAQLTSSLGSKTNSKQRRLNQIWQEVSDTNRDTERTGWNWACPSEPCPKRQLMAAVIYGEINSHILRVFGFFSAIKGFGDPCPLVPVLLGRRAGNWCKEIALRTWKVKFRVSLCEPSDTACSPFSFVIVFKRVNIPMKV